MSLAATAIIALTLVVSIDTAFTCLTLASLHYEAVDENSEPSRVPQRVLVDVQAPHFATNRYNEDINI